jgi:hypothetical protein
VATGTSGSFSVTTPDGTASLTGFTFIPAPAITSFTPTSTGAGMEVTITGTNLSGATAVSFGGTAATAFSITSPTTITATVGSGASGSVSVTTPGGAASLADFNFIPAPTISSFTPSSAETGTAVTITGTNFTGATRVSFGAEGAASFTVNSSTSITAIVGPGASGSVVVSTNGGTASVAGFTYRPVPTITSFTPSSAAQGTQVTITGTNFIGVTEIKLGNTSVTFTVNSATSITATVSSGPGGDVTVTTSHGTATKPGFIYLPSITPNSPTTFIAGGNVILKEPTGSLTGYTYQWTKDGVDIPNATQSSYTATESGSYTVKITTGTTTVTSSPIVVKAIFALPVNNYQIVSNGETCKTSNNGSFSITAVNSHNYNAVITGTNYNKSVPFINNSLSVTGLAAGKYKTCISVSGQADYTQCFDIVITEPADLSVYSLVDHSNNHVNLHLQGGNNYTVELNGVTYYTSKTEMNLPLSSGNNLLKVSTDTPCQGTIERVISLGTEVLVYPNPFERLLNLSLGNNASQPAVIEIRTMDGKLAFSEKFDNHNGRLQLDLSLLNPGLYTLKLSFGKSEFISKIVKK